MRTSGRQAPGASGRSVPPACLPSLCSQRELRSTTNQLQPQRYSIRRSADGGLRRHVVAATERASECQSLMSRETRIPEKRWPIFDIRITMSTACDSLRRRKPGSKSRTTETSWKLGQLPTDKQSEGRICTRHPLRTACCHRSKCQPDKKFLDGHCDQFTSIRVCNRDANAT